MIFPILLLLPLIPLVLCAYEDYKTRMVPGYLLGALAAAYIPLGIYFFDIGIYSIPATWILIAPQIVMWFVLLIYGIITGRGGADRVVILLGSCTHVIGLLSLLAASFISGFSTIIKDYDHKFPFIVPYAVAYIVEIFYLFASAAGI